MGGEGMGGNGREGDRRGVLWTVESTKFLKIDPAPRPLKFGARALCLMLLVPRAWTATGRGSFAVNGPATRNRLPPALRSPDLSESAFKRALKTHLFSIARRH